MSSFTLIWDDFWKSSVVEGCDKNAWILALWLITNAKKRQEWFKGVEIPRGAVAYSERKVATLLKMGHQEMRTARSQLTNIGFLTHESTQGFTTVHICNFDRWQDKTNILSNTGSSKNQHTPNTVTPELNRLTGIRNIRTAKNPAAVK